MVWIKFASNFDWPKQFADTSLTSDQKLNLKLLEYNAKIIRYPDDLRSAGKTEYDILQIVFSSEEDMMAFVLEWS